MLAEARAAEAMFNAALGRAPGLPVPELQAQGLRERLSVLPELGAALESASRHRSELHMSEAEIRRAYGSAAPAGRPVRPSLLSGSTTAMLQRFDPRQ